MGTNLVSRLVNGVDYLLKIYINSNSHRRPNTANVNGASFLLRLLHNRVRIRIISSTFRRQTTRRRFLVVNHWLEASLRVNRISRQIIQHKRRVRTNVDLRRQNRRRVNRTPYRGNAYGRTNGSLRGITPGRMHRFRRVSLFFIVILVRNSLRLLIKRLVSHLLFRLS